MPGLGTIINTAAIVVGGLLGLLFKNLLTKSMEDTLLKASSVCVLFIGIGGAIAGGLISSFGYETMFTGMSVFNLLSIMIYVLIGRNHPSSFSYRKRMAR